MYNHSSNLKIGDDCMISNSVTIRLGEISVILIYEKRTRRWIKYHIRWQSGFLISFPTMWIV